MQLRATIAKPDTIEYRRSSIDMSPFIRSPSRRRRLFLRYWQVPKKRWVEQQNPTRIDTLDRATRLFDAAILDNSTR